MNAFCRALLVLTLVVLPQYFAFAHFDPNLIDLQVPAGETYTKVVGTKKAIIGLGQSSAGQIMRSFNPATGLSIASSSTGGAGSSFYDAVVKGSRLCAVGVVEFDDNADGGSNLYVTCVNLPNLSGSVSRIFEAPDDPAQDIRVDNSLLNPTIQFAVKNVVVRFHRMGSARTSILLLDSKTMLEVVSTP
jgi:hypothetical protein